MQKERFPQQKRSKLMLTGDEPFQILDKINDNAYKTNLLGEYCVNVTFNMFNLFLFDVSDDSWMNFFFMREEMIRSRLYQKIHCIFKLVQFQDQWQKSSKMHSTSLFKVFGPR
jgi:hypothetical protein